MGVLIAPLINKNAGKTRFTNMTEITKTQLSHPSNTRPRSLLGFLPFFNDVFMFIFMSNNNQCKRVTHGPGPMFASKR